MDDIEISAPEPPKKIDWLKVTPLSKILAMILFILLPFIGFYLGIEYGHTRLKILETKKWLVEYQANLLQESQSESQNNLADWQTYRNEEFGFEFMYPEGFSSTDPEILPVDCETDKFPEECPFIPVPGTPYRSVEKFNTAVPSELEIKIT